MNVHLVNVQAAKFIVPYLPARIIAAICVVDMAAVIEQRSITSV